MKVGDRVKVIAISDWLLRDIPVDEQQRLLRQKGCVVEVRGLQPHDHLWLAFSDGTEGFALERKDVELLQVDASDV